MEAVPQELKPGSPASLAATAEKRKDADGRAVTLLEHHLRRYTRKNSSDFFIHKDLKGFLNRELDFYLKNEALNVDDLLEADDSGVTLMEDAISDSLFQGINEPDSRIEMLVGAKKFMEGWNSWRVSNMGLLNIGRKEGSEIIQLFVRGVRLRGMNFSLKRSAVLAGKHPEHLPILETLNIFAVRANYMTQFREYLERGGMETEGTVSLPLPIRLNEDFLNQGLLISRIPEDRKFAEERDILLEADPKIQVRVDMALRVEAVESQDGKILRRETTAGQDRPIPAECLHWLDWDRLYLELLKYKERNGMSNLAIPLSAPREIIAAREPGRCYRLVADDTLFHPAAFAGLERLHEAVLTILRKYVDKFYRDRKKRWESEHMEYRRLDETDPNLRRTTLTGSQFLGFPAHRSGLFSRAFW